ncbi:MAG: DNA polymerase III subunit delta' [Gemmatimonadota bacterium]
MVARLADIRGQGRAVALLGRYLASGKVPPGILFFGEEGIGKEKAAEAFAAALLCRAPAAGDACGTCPDCLLCASGSHPNLLRVLPEGRNILIDDVRRLQEELSLKAFSDRPRVALVVPADRLTVQAANALLKTLEEPPPATHLVLVSHRLSRLPPTIVSRCQKVPFSPLPPEEAAEILRGLPEGAGTRPEAIRAAVACAGGSPGRALELLDGAEEERAEWLRLLAKPDPAAISRTAAGWKGAGEAAPLLAVPLSVLRDLALLSSGAEGAIMNRDLRELLRPVAARRDPGEWTRALRELLAVSGMPPQAQKPLLLEAFLFGLHGKE